MNFDSPSSVSSGSNADNLKAQLQQLQIQAAQEYHGAVIQRLADKCFKKCVEKPGSSLSNGEQKCVTMCVDRFLETTKLVGQSAAQYSQQQFG